MPRHEREHQTVAALCRAWELVDGATIEWHLNEEAQKAQGFLKPCEQLVYRNGVHVAIEHIEAAYFPNQQRQNRTLTSVRTVLLAELRSRLPGVPVDDWFIYPDPAPFYPRDKALIDFAMNYANRVVAWRAGNEPESFEEAVPGTEMVLRTELTPHSRRESLGYSRPDDVSGLPGIVVESIGKKREKLHYLKGLGLRTVLLLDTHPMGHSGWYTDYANAFYHAIRKSGGTEELTVVDELYLACDLYEGISIAIPLKVDGDVERLQALYWQIQRDRCTP